MPRVVTAPQSAHLRLQFFWRWRYSLSLNSCWIRSPPDKSTPSRALAWNENRRVRTNSVRKRQCSANHQHSKSEFSEKDRCSKKNEFSKKDQYIENSKNEFSKKHQCNEKNEFRKKHQYGKNDFSKKDRYSKKQQCSESEFGKKHRHGENEVSKSISTVASTLDSSSGISTSIC